MYINTVRSKKRIHCIIISGKNMKLTSSANAAIFAFVLILQISFQLQILPQFPYMLKVLFRCLKNIWILNQTSSYRTKLTNFYATPSASAFFCVFSITEYHYFFLRSFTCFVNLLFDSFLALYVLEFKRFAPNVYLLV